MSRGGFNQFMDLVASGAKEPSRSNLYEVRVPIPAVVWVNNPDLRARQSELAQAIDYFADDVSVPGRRVTTSSVKDIGVQRKYASGQAVSEFTCSFIVTKDMIHRQLFDLWMNYTAADQENRVTFYDEYITNIVVCKWELAAPVKSEGFYGDRLYSTRLNRASAVWQMYGAFPIDISGHQFSNAQVDLVKLDVTFAYERHRFDTIANDLLPWKADVDDKIISPFSEISDILGVNIEQSEVVGFS